MSLFAYFAAIRPDRDKTGRQRNPRKSSLTMVVGPNKKTSITSMTGGDLPNMIDSSASSSPDTGDCTSASDRASSAPVLCATVNNTVASASVGTPTMSASVPKTTAETTIVLETLIEIEHICNQLRDASTTCIATGADSSTISLEDAVERPSLIASRQPVSALK
jgi:hypothetical protein